MPIKTVEILSQDTNFPFGESVENFFEKYFVSEDVEIYKFFYDPNPVFTGFADLEEIKYKSKIIFWITNDSFDPAEEESFMVNGNDIRTELKKIEKICKLHSDKIFIVCSWQFNLNSYIDAKNLLVVNPINTIFSKKYIRCNDKSIGSKKWVTLNNTMKPHRVALVSYLLSKHLDCEGVITAGDNYHFLKGLIAPSKYFDGVFKYFNFKDYQKSIKKGFKRFKKKKYTDLNIPVGNYLKLQDNFLDNLIPVYKTTALEIVSCSSFLDNNPIIGEKEIQNIYAQNFPIYIGPLGTAKIMKDFYGFDIFEDIIDHSYDSIKDPQTRLTSAIDKNIHLLKDTVDLNTLWLKNKERFEKNCDLADKLYFNRSVQQDFDFNQIKKALDYFKIKYCKI